MLLNVLINPDNLVNSTLQTMLLSDAVNTKVA